MDKHLRPKDVATMLGVSVDVVYKLVDSGQLARLRVGRAISIPTASLKDFIAQNTKPAGIAEPIPASSKSKPVPPPGHGRKRRGKAGTLNFPPPLS